MDERSQSSVGLASWLGGGSVLIVLVAVAAIAIACDVLLHRMIERQGLVQAQLAATAAREILQRNAWGTEVPAAQLSAIGRQIGAQVRVLSLRDYQAPPDDSMTALHTDALSAQSGAAATHLRDTSQYAAALVLHDARGDAMGLLDARIDATELMRETRLYDWTVAVTATVVAAIAGLLGVWYGRWLARPVVALRNLAQRLGEGDFAVAVPAEAPMEVGALAHSMDTMRVNLIALTSALRQRDAESRTVLGAIVEGVYAVDDQRRIRYANPQVARLLGQPPEQIVGRFCGDVLQPALVAGVRPCEQSCPILRARAAGADGSHTARETLCLPDGTQRSTIIVSSPPEQGLQVQILRDETDLESARRARDSVLGNISHEFRTPLAAQLVSIELLRNRDQPLTAAASEEMLANIERGVRRLMRLVDNLLESVRLEAGQKSIRRQEVDMAEVIDGAHEQVAPLLAQRSIGVEIQHPDVDINLIGDAQRLEQVFINLLANAGKYAPTGSTIRIGGRRLDTGTCDLWVEDAGTESPTGGTLDQSIFERFQRGSQGEPEAPGLGLGLWIVKSICERHGGGVRVERTSTGCTRFTITLPLTQGNAA